MLVIIIIVIQFDKTRMNKKIFLLKFGQFCN
jgi:hypothetical protein